MAWFRIDDKMHSHPKIRQAGLAAAGLWAVSGPYSRDYSLDGRVPVEWVTTWPQGRKLAGVLVTVGLWHALPTDCPCVLPTVDQGKGGWVFHDWNDCNPSEAEMETTRTTAAAQQAVARDPELRSRIRGRDQNRCRYCGARVKWNDRRGTTGGTYSLIAHDGPHDETNLVVCCRGCLDRKGQRTPEQAGMKLLPEPSQLF